MAVRSYTAVHFPSGTSSLSIRVECAACGSASRGHIAIAERPRARGTSRLEIFLAVVFLVGIAGRVASLSGGFPEVFYRDEDDVVESALYTITGDLNPHIYKYPSLLSCILGVAFRVALAGENLGDAETVSAILARFQEDPAPLMLVARAVALAISLVALPAVYFTARRLWGAREAFLATAFLALSPLHLDLSRVARVDAPCAALTIVAMWLALRFVDSPSWSRFVSMGIAAGAAAAFKEYGGGIVIPIMLLIVTSPIRRRVGVAVAHGALAVIAFAALSPFLILEYGEFIDFVKHSGGLYTTPYWGDGQSTLPGVSGLLARYAAGSIGTIGCAAYLVDIVRRPRRARGREVIATLGYLALLCGAFFAADTFFVRFFLPALPFFCLAAARGLVLLIERAALAPRTARMAAACVLAAGGLWLAADFLGTARWLAAREDPRLRSADWIERNIPRDMPIVTGFRRNSPYIFSVEEPLAHRVPTLRRILEAHAPEHLASLDASVDRARARAATEGWSVHYERDTLAREAAKRGNEGAALVITFEKTKDFRKTDREKAIARLQATHAPAAEFPGGWHGALGPPTQIWMPR